MTPSRRVHTWAKRALKVVPVAFTRAEYVPRAMTRLPTSKNSFGSVCQFSKISEQTREEATEHIVHSEINIAVRKTFDYFPTHVGCKHLANHVGITARFVKALYDGDVVVGLHFHRRGVSLRSGSFRAQLRIRCREASSWGLKTFRDPSVETTASWFCSCPAVW